MRSSSRRPKLRWKAGMSEPRYPSDKSVEVVVKLRAYRDQAAIVGSNAKPGFSINDQVADNNLDAVVAVAEVLNQCTHTASNVFVIVKPGGRPRVARHERALPLIVDPCP